MRTKTCLQLSENGGKSTLSFHHYRGETKLKRNGLQSPQTKMSKAEKKKQIQINLQNKKIKKVEMVSTKTVIDHTDKDKSDLADLREKLNNRKAIGYNTYQTRVLSSWQRK